MNTSILGRGWKILLSLMLLTALAGCAHPPRYVTQTSYLPPQDKQGRACVSQCHAQLQACKKSCQAKREACIKKIEPQAMAAFQDAIKRYEAARQQYETDRQFYEMNRRLSWSIGWANHHWPYYGSGFWMTDEPYWDMPNPPPAPSYKAERQRLIKQQCDKPCGCQDPYEQCFVGCGGTIRHTQVCVQNCGPNDLKASQIPHVAPPSASSSTRQQQQ